MSPVRVARTRLLVKVAGTGAGRPFLVETRRPLFPGENLEDATQDKLRAAWAGAALGAFGYALDPAGSGRRVGRFTGAGKVYAGSTTRRERLVPGDQLQTTLRGYRTTSTAPLVLGVDWQDETGASYSEVIGSLPATTPANAWTELDMAWDVPATARAGVVYVSTTAAGWYLDNGAGVTDLASRTSTDVGAITIRRGRTSPDEIPTPASCSASFPITGAVPVASGDLVTVEVPVERYLGAGVDPGVFVRFRGNATDPELNIRRNQLHTLELVAVSSLARLGRIDVGDTPWPQEPAETRAERILNLAAAQDALLSVAASAGVDPGPDVVPRDVDSQPALSLLGELVESTGGQVIESRADGTIYFRSRAWAYGDGFMPTIQLGAGHYAEPLKLAQAPAVNSARVFYGATDPQPFVDVEDPASVAQLGRVAKRVTTQLATEADAYAYALDMLGAGSRPAYQLDRLEIDLVDLWRREDAGQPVGALALSLLSLEPGDVIEVLDLPPVVPELPGHAWFGVEGWTETITPTSWRLQLDLVDFARLAAPAPWTDIPLDVAWADLPPDLTWAGLGAWRPR